MTVMESLEAIFRDVFDDENILINVATTANDMTSGIVWLK